MYPVPTEIEKGGTLGKKQRSKKNMQREDVCVCVCVGARARARGVHGGNWVEPETKMRTQRN